jgi:uroporphyrinogen decarboxylase
MTHRERLLTALDHREPDRVPMDLGTARFTTMVKAASQRLCDYLGFGKTGPILDRMQQLVEVDERILEYLDVDCRAFSQGAPDRGADEDLGEGRYRDEWGVIRSQPPGSHYYDLEVCPLAGDITPADIARYPWPDPADPGRFRGLRETALRLHQTDYAIMYNARFHLIHMTQYLRGFYDWYLDLGANHELFRSLMDAVLDVLIEINRRAFREVGDLIDVVAFGDDIGQQDRPVCSLDTYRRLIRPYQERIVDCIKSHTRAKILYHTCGSVYRLIPDFIELGIDALNPIQVSARHMEPERLKREFGDRIAFWGGIDTQHLLPHGTPEEVRAGVRRTFETLGQGGGWVLTSVHNVQPDVPPENLLAMFDEGRQCVYGAVPVA